MERSLVYNAGSITVQGSMSVGKRLAEEQPLAQRALFANAQTRIESDDQLFDRVEDEPLTNDSRAFKRVRVRPQGIFVALVDQTATDSAITCALKRVTKRYRFSENEADAEWVFTDRSGVWTDSNGLQSVTTSDEDNYYIAAFDMYKYMFKCIPEVENQFVATNAREEFELFVTMDGATTKFGIRIEPRIFYQPSETEFRIPTQGLDRVIKTTVWSFDKAPYTVMCDPFEMGLCGMIGENKEQLAFPENLSFKTPRARWGEFRVDDSDALPSANPLRKSFANLTMDREAIFTSKRWFDSGVEFDDGKWVRSADTYTNGSLRMEYKQWGKYISLVDTKSRLGTISLQAQAILGYPDADALNEAMRVSPHEINARDSYEDVVSSGETEDGKYRVTVKHNHAGQCYVDSIVAAGQTQIQALAWKYYSFGNYIKVSTNKVAADYYTFEFEHGSATISLPVFDKAEFDRIVSDWLE